MRKNLNQKKPYLNQQIKRARQENRWKEAPLLVSAERALEVVRTERIRIPERRRRVVRKLQLKSKGLVYRFIA
jgi:hypothetical protein